MSCRIRLIADVKDEEAASPLDKKEDNELPKDDMNDEDDDDDDNPLEDVSIGALL